MGGAGITPSTHMESTRGDLGQGLYSLQELQTYVAYGGSRKDAARVLMWLTEVLNPVRHKSRQPDYSFSDLISLFVVRELRNRGVPAHRIRDAEEHLRHKWGTDRPFVSERIATDGQHVYSGEEIAAEQPARIETASLKGQQAMLVPIRDRLSTVHYVNGAAQLWQPADHVVLDPERQFGEPVILGTRVPVATIAVASRNRDVDEVASTYGIAPAAARDAVRFQRRLDELRAPRGTT